MNNVERFSADEAARRWVKLGIAFATPATDAVPDPEATLIGSLGLLQEERKFAGLILGWIDRWGDLIHVARIKALSGSLNHAEYAWLGTLAAHASANDSRWTLIERFVAKQLQGDPIAIESSPLDHLVAKKNGADPEAERFGLIVPTLRQAKDGRFFTRQHVIDHHPWLRLRALFGANWRADIAWQFVVHPEQTAFRAAKSAGCTVETAYRTWRALKEANAHEFLYS